MKKWMIGSLFCLCLCGSAFAETFHSVKVSGLDFGAEAKEAQKSFEHGAYSAHGRIPLGVRCLEECHLGPAGGQNQGYMAGNQGEFELVFRLEKESPVKGFVDLRVLNPDGALMDVKGFAFTFEPGEKSRITKERFEKIRDLESGWLALGHIPGTAWFRHLSQGVEEGRRPVTRNSDLSDSFAIFSGGRAISENLALDRELILAAGKDGQGVVLSEIKGVTVAAIDWAGRLPEKEVPVDELSLALPEDQHAVFAKSLPELLEWIERMETQLMPTAQAYSVRSPFRRLASRYQKQMGLDVPALAARLLPAKSVAITGGDPFFPQGTDVAFVMESGNSDLLFKALLKLIEAKASKAGAAPVELPGQGDEYRGFATSDRSFSSHLWRMGDVVAVSNSKMQIKRLSEVAEKKRTALGTTDEYRFFRNRYPLGEKESAFVFLSDATIRRWAGPELRIAASRRTRAVAALGELTSQALAGGEITGDYMPLLGRATWKDGRMSSEFYGSLDFITPASELGISSATLPEKIAYERWLSGYEKGWAQAFDPIAIRIRSDKESVGIDLSVMPLTIDSRYSELVALCGKAELGEMARWVPEESALHAGIALDVKSEAFRKYDKQIIGFLPGVDVNPLGWMQGSVSMDLEESLFWEAGSTSDFQRFTKLPVVVRIGSNSRLKLALFMTVLKNAVESSAPDSLRWETRKGDSGSYVAITGNEGGVGEDFRIYYATTPNALLVSLREDPLLRAMRRENHPLSAEESAALPAATQLMLDSSPAFLSGLQGVFKSITAADRIREESWKALPILNEWHRKFAGEDPVAVQLKHYGEDVFCPGGKGYRWNPEAMTMESVAFGYPARPKFEPASMPGIFDFKSVTTSLKFQDDGLRAELLIGGPPKRLVIPVKENSEPVALATAAGLTPLIEGTTLSYKGRTYGMPESMTTKIDNVIREGEKVVFEMVSQTRQDGEKKMDYRARYLLHEGLKMTSSRYEEGGTQYTEPHLELPEKLISGDVTTMRIAGTSEHKMEGETHHEEFKGTGVIRVIGKEDIEVPAGRFAGCVRIEVSNELLSGSRFESQKSVMWYHAGTGMVKFEYLEGQDSMMELHEISIPQKAD